MENAHAIPIKKHSIFSWGRMGDIAAGRPTMGTSMNIAVYRLLQQSLVHVLVSRLGTAEADRYFIASGQLAGYEFAMNNLVLEQSSEDFFKQLSCIFLQLKIGKSSVEQYHSKTGEITVSIENNLECSGMDSYCKTVCKFDEGFLSGLLEAYTGEEYTFKEVDCWAYGSAACRFIGTIK